MANQQNREFLKRKVNTLKSIMGNPKLSRMIKESLDAPIGSTKRHQSKSIVSILKKLGSDGQGGPGMPGMYPSISPTTPQIQNVVPNSGPGQGNIMIFPAAPKFKMKPTGGDSSGYNPPTSKTNELNGQGGPGLSMTGMNMSDPSKLTVGSQSQTPSTLFSGINLRSMTSPQQSGLSTLGYNPSSAVTNSTNNQKFNIGSNNLSNLTVGSQQTPKPDASKYENKYFGFNVPTKQATSPDLTVSAVSQPVTQPNGAYGFDIRKFLQDSGIISKPAESQPVEQVATENVQTVKRTPWDASIEKQSQTGTKDSSITTPQTQTSTDRSTPSMYGAVSNAVQNNVGPAGFALNAMNDIETLKKLFPGVPEDQLPVGASLSGQIDGLSTALKKEYDLDALRNRMSNMQHSGATLQDNIKDYVRGKDEYVSYVDGLIDESNNRLLGMDTANPEVRNNMENYQKYLSMMKGRQNQRYIDYLNTSINQYNADLTNVTNNYNSALDLYNTELKTKATIAQEDYNRLYTTLVDMYNTVSEAPDKALNRQLLQQQLYNAQAQALIDVTTALGNKNSAKYWEEQSKYKDNIIDKDGNVLPNFNLSNAIYQAQQQGYAPEGVLNLTERGMNNSLSTAAPATALANAKTYKDMIADFASQGGGQVAYDMGTSVMNNAGEALSKYVLQNAPTIKDAISGLSPSGMFGGKKPMPAKDQWVADYQNSVDKEVLGSIYDYVQRETAANPNMDFNYLFTDDGKKVSNATDEEVANKLRAGITEGWKYEIARAANGI